MKILMVIFGIGALIVGLLLSATYATDLASATQLAALVRLSPETVIVLCFSVFAVTLFVGSMSGYRAAETIKNAVQEAFAVPFVLLSKLLEYLNTKKVWRSFADKCYLILYRIKLEISSEHVVRFIERRFANAKDKSPVRQALLRGDLVPFAEANFPKEKYPLMWRGDIPSDLKRPLVIDGRLPNGDLPADLVARNAIDRDFVKKALRLSIVPAIFWFFALFFFYNPNAWLVDVPASIDRIAQYAPAKMDAPGASLKGDFWSNADYQAALQKAASEPSKQSWLTPSSDAYIAARNAVSSGSNGTLTAALFALAVMMGFLRWQVLTATNRKVAAISTKPKDAVVRYKYRQEQRQMYDAAHVQQVEFATGFDAGTPTISIGKGTGVFYYRGSLSGYEKGNDFRMSLSDLSQHVLVYGGTGEGKTRSTIAPFVRQMLTLRGEQLAQGNTHYISMFATDAKAVLWRDIKKIADELGQGRDVRVIGTGDGEYGVDMLDGVSPQLVADIISGVAKQAAGGGKADDFWPTMASEVIRNAAIIAKAWAATSDGQSYAQETSEAPYSLVTIYLLTMSEKLMERALGGINNVMSSGLDCPVEIMAVKDEINGELTYAIKYITETWAEMAVQTKSGITANITKVMSPFAVDTKLRERFASGSPAKLTRISDLWGRINLISISTLEHGLAGRIINVMLKTLMYSEARKREILDPQIGNKEKMLFVADEFQDLITSDENSVSDSNFWNVARSTGVMGFIATQGLSALQQAIGEQNAENFTQQMRSKIILRVEDISTINYAVALAGETIRSYSSDGDSASFAEQIAELDESPVSTKAMELRAGRSDLIRAIPDAFWHFLGAGASCVSDSYAQEPSYAYTNSGFADSKTNELGLITREEMRGKGSKALRELSVISIDEMQREESLIREYYHANNSKDNVLKVDDVIGMGRGQAVVFVQRGGVTKADIVRLGV